MKFSAASAILALTARVTYADFFRNDFLPVGHTRTDAIINPDCLSDHVHTFYGPPLLYPKLTFDDLRNSDPSLSSGNIEENNSLYWHPAVYHVADNGKKTLQESEMTTVYYNWKPGKTTAFPPGFRMVTPGEDVFDEGKTPGAGEMELSISFQSCWDGVNLDSPDHMSHVAFPKGKNEKCPKSHPVKIPRLDFFIRWFNTKKAKWRFADDSLRFHADYVSGWDESFLQSLLDGGDGDFDSKVTFRAGIKHEGNDKKLIKQMNKNKVPKADTSCITTEKIDTVFNLPRGACNGTLISPIGVCDGSSTPTPTPQPSESLSCKEINNEDDCNNSIIGCSWETEIKQIKECKVKKSKYNPGCKSLSKENCKGESDFCSYNDEQNECQHLCSYHMDDRKKCKSVKWKKAKICKYRIKENECFEKCCPADS